MHAVSSIITLCMLAGHVYCNLLEESFHKFLEVFRVHLSSESSLIILNHRLQSFLIRRLRELKYQHGNKGLNKHVACDGIPQH